MSIVSQIERLRSAKEDIILAIKEKGVFVSPSAGLSDMAGYISDISTSAAERADEDKDFKFYDYDGTLLFSYTMEELQNLTDLPPFPAHSGLTSQGWNWTLAELKALDYGMNVGAVYITDDDATRLHIKIEDISRNEIPLYFYQTVSDGVTINWGDGSATETVSGTSNVSTSHTYSHAGEYTICLSPASGCSIRLGHNASGYFVFGEASTKTRAIANILKGVNIGIRCTTLNSYTFQYCRSLEYITIPSSTTSLGSYTFNYCNSLKAVILPSRPTNTSTYTFAYCYNLRVVSLPLRITSIGASSFRGCHCLYSITVPPDVTALNGYCFSECYSLRTVVLPSGLTSLGNYAFYKCYSLCRVSIPDSLQSIGSNVFYQNNALAYIDIPDTVTSIGTYAFYECQALMSLDIPSGVTVMSSSAFYNCTGMKYYYIYATTPPTFQASAFNNIPSDCVIYVPAGCIDAYLADSGWVILGDHIREMN